MSQVLYYFFGSLINIDLFVCLFIVLGYFLWKTTGSKIGAKFLGCGVFVLLMIGILPTSQ